MKERTVSIDIPEGLYERLEKMAKKKGMAPHVYLINILREALCNEKIEEEIISPEEKEAIRKRLKELGYL